MNQETYQEYCDRISLYKKYDIKESIDNHLQVYISKAERLLNDEYKYGSSWLDLYLLDKYVNKCEELIRYNNYVENHQFLKN